MLFRYKKSFQKRFDRLNYKEQQLVIEADKQIHAYYISQKVPYGLRITKLYDDGENKIFEGRASDKIRIPWVEAKKLVSFIVLGNHEDVKNFLKNWR